MPRWRGRDGARLADAARMTRGHGPLADWAPLATSRASGAKPCRSAASPVASTTDAAPSRMPEALPAVTEPSALNTGRSVARSSCVSFARTCSSTRNPVSPPRRRAVTAAVRPSKRHCLVEAGPRHHLPVRVAGDAADGIQPPMRTRSRAMTLPSTTNTTSQSPACAGVRRSTASPDAGT